MKTINFIIFALVMLVGTATLFGQASLKKAAPKPEPLPQHLALFAKPEAVFFTFSDNTETSGDRISNHTVTTISGGGIQVNALLGDSSCTFQFHPLGDSLQISLRTITTDTVILNLRGTSTMPDLNNWDGILRVEVDSNDFDITYMVLEYDYDTTPKDAATTPAIATMESLWPRLASGSSDGGSFGIESSSVVVTGNVVKFTILAGGKKYYEVMTFETSQDGSQWQFTSSQVGKSKWTTIPARNATSWKIEWQTGRYKTSTYTFTPVPQQTGDSLPAPSTGNSPALPPPASGG